MTSGVRSAVALGGFLASVWIVQGLAVLFTRPGIPGWYASLRKPSWTPPGWLFGPTWSVLYVLMAVAAWIVWRQHGRISVVSPLTVFAVQLVLNAAWSALFFGLRLPGLAFAEITALWIAVAVTLVCFWRISPAAGALLIPYLAWVGFAAALNLAIWRANP